MNKKGNFFWGSVIGIYVFIMGVLFIPFITPLITQQRTDLNCALPGSITGGTMLTCLLGDLIIPYFIWFIVSFALGYIGGKSIQ